MKGCRCETCRRTRILIIALQHGERDVAHAVYQYEFPDTINKVARSTISGEDFVATYHGTTVTDG